MNTKTRTNKVCGCLSILAGIVIKLITLWAFTLGWIGWVKFTNPDPFGLMILTAVATMIAGTIVLVPIVLGSFLLIGMVMQKPKDTVLLTVIVTLLVPVGLLELWLCQGIGGYTIEASGFWLLLMGYIYTWSYAIVSGGGELVTRFLNRR